ncbi:unnamed protein product [Porites lobata]|uniref:C-type lectin domain-containing protein n=1 Tax=Porites lobata TaxID=104759 RepID=A0ABN8N238_9CNID|nr:unnamed protein product [Porites lobata]
MYKDFKQNYGLFDDLPCSFKRHGYICEREKGDCHFRAHGRTMCLKVVFSIKLERNSLDFDNSRKACKVYGSDLVSIESNEEWNFLKDAVNKFPQS